MACCDYINTKYFCLKLLQCIYELQVCDDECGVSEEQIIFHIQNRFCLDGDICTQVRIGLAQICRKGFVSKFCNKYKLVGPLARVLLMPNCSKRTKRLILRLRYIFYNPLGGPCCPPCPPPCCPPPSSSCCKPSCCPQPCCKPKPCCQPPCRKPCPQPCCPPPCKPCCPPPCSKPCCPPPCSPCPPPCCKPCCPPPPSKPCCPPPCCPQPCKPSCPEPCKQRCSQSCRKPSCAQPCRKPCCPPPCFKPCCPPPCKPSCPPPCNPCKPPESCPSCEEQSEEECEEEEQNPCCPCDVKKGSTNSASSSTEDQICLSSGKEIGRTTKKRKQTGNKNGSNHKQNKYTYYRKCKTKNIRKRSNNTFKSNRGSSRTSSTRTENSVSNYTICENCGDFNLICKCGYNNKKRLKRSGSSITPQNFYKKVRIS